MMTTIHHKKNRSSQQGFALLFTVLIVSTILSLAVGISNITFKQNLLTSIAKDSQIAFFTADSGMECAVYLDFSGLMSSGGVGDGMFPRGGDSSSVMQTTPAGWCGGMTFSLDMGETKTSYYVYRENVSNQKNPCRIIVFDRTHATLNKIQSRGYNTCIAGPRQVERALEVEY